MSYDNITAAMVLWNESARIGPLVKRLRPYFQRIVAGVQESTDGTLELAQQLVDEVRTDAHHGYGDATFGPKVLPMVHTEWTLKVDGDEMPSKGLLASLGDAVIACEEQKRDGAWLPFRSWIDGEEWKEQHGHLRLFRTRLGWPSTLHSRPMTENTLSWNIGWIEHKRSLDEMIRDYLNYYRAGMWNSQWVEHNTLMMREACKGAAKLRGWEYVEAFDWWPDVRAVAFTGEHERV